ncbi:MAG TPA: V-type ATPase 116kDa subunit family protein [Tissierellaceae bacterium]|nr:V-type ATPase 116kDa subunit family protein [Tissierellaceae bacterium]
MSIEKMTMMNIIGKIDMVDDVLKNLLKTRKVDLVSAVSQIERSNFLFDVNDENVDMLVDLNYIHTFEKSEECEEMFRKGEELKAALDLDFQVDRIDEDMKLVSKEELSDELDSICKEVHGPSTMIVALKKELAYLDDFHSNSFRELEEFPVKVEDLRNMEYFDFKMGILSRENLLKLKKNYDNILSVLLHTGSSAEGEVYFAFYPKKLESEITRILRSLNFKEIILPKSYTGTPEEIRASIESQKERLHMEIEGQQKILDDIKAKYQDRIRSIMEQIWITTRLDDLKEKVAFSSNYFYLSGWVAQSEKEEISSSVAGHDDVLIKFKEEENLEPPTKLKNNWFFRPFQWLVNLYGTPSYNELDPTPFVGLSYMLLFGMMFGDLGQGFVMVVAGYFISKKMELFGGLLSRIGIASMIFGTLYGAVFGIEHWIPALWMRPFENINDILIVAIFVGIFVLLVAYIYGIINAYKRKDLEEGVFGHAGVAGVILYLTLLVTVGGSLLGISIIPVPLGIGIAVAALLAIVFRLPLTHLIEGKRPLHGGDVSGYYVESIFSLIETFLSMLSGTISFIRVGAFALTHVGLFLAFETIGHMMGSAMGNVIVLIIGNIFVLGLEGLIVFIQGMRLQYYELFSRYYSGDGKEFNPVSLGK